MTAQADSLLLRWIASALRLLGADVRIRERAENSVRLVPAALARAFAAPVCAEQAISFAQGLRAHEGPACACIDVEGLPNLLHELVHVVLAGRLDDDHGFDYGAIPYDLERPDGRAVLWNELSACVVSCAYLQTSGHASTRVDAWFDEQLGIQPIFYGRDQEADAFFAELPARVRTHADELARVTSAAYERCAALLRWAGAPVAIAEVAHRHDFVALWLRREHARGAAA
jgi:hypothetical protein